MELIDEIKKLVKTQLASYAVPQRVLVNINIFKIKYFLLLSLFMNYFSQITNNLPKTRSGKILRRILRKIAENKFNELGDTSTLADPSVVDDIILRQKKTNEKSSS